MTPLEFIKHIWCQKTKFPGYGVDLLIEHQLVTNGQTEGLMDRRTRT